MISWLLGYLPVEPLPKPKGFFQEHQALLFPPPSPMPPFFQPSSFSSPNRYQSPSASACLPYISLYPLPPYLSLPHYFSLWPTLSLLSPSVFVKPYTAPLLSHSIFPPRLFSSIHTPALGTSSLCWWESGKRGCDCRLRNRPHFLKDSSACKSCLLLHWWMLLKLEGLYLWAQLYRWREAHRITFRWDGGSINRHLSLDTHHTKHTLLFIEKRETRDLQIGSFYVCTDRPLLIFSLNRTRNTQFQSCCLHCS